MNLAQSAQPAPHDHGSLHHVLERAVAQGGFGPREPFEVLVEQQQELVRLIGPPDDPRLIANH